MEFCSHTCIVNLDPVGLAVKTHCLVKMQNRHVAEVRDARNRLENEEARVVPPLRTAKVASCLSGCAHACAEERRGPLLSSPWVVGCRRATRRRIWCACHGIQGGREGEREGSDSS
jgi:hypothetical protein